MPEKMWNTQYMEDFNKKQSRSKTKSSRMEIHRHSNSHPKKVSILYTALYRRIPSKRIENNMISTKVAI